MKELCVVHLVRAQNGIEPFRRFLESYQANPGGIEHDLLIVFKGFAQPQGTAEYLDLLASIRHTTFQVPDEGFDITAYFSVVRFHVAKYRYFCFLNSHSVILDPQWLSKLYKQISRPGVGLVGATGSWESRRSLKLSWSNIRDVMLSYYSLHKGKIFWKSTILGVFDAWEYFVWEMRFDLFPNYHLRTNAFMISGQVMTELKCIPLRDKMDAYRFESGKIGMTKQILRRRKKVIVVGRDGNGYEKDIWNTSKTFRQSEQENLLVADNQTRDYQYGTLERREFLSTITWGNENDVSTAQAK